MDWTEIGALGALFAGTAALSGGIGAFAHRYYMRGKLDGNATAVNIQTAASIVRIETHMAELTSTFHQHVVDDARSFGELKATVNACTNGLKQAAEAMQNLTNRLDTIATGRSRN